MWKTETKCNIDELVQKRVGILHHAKMKITSPRKNNVKITLLVWKPMDRNTVKQNMLRKRVHGSNCSCCISPNISNKKQSTSYEMLGKMKKSYHHIGKSSIPMQT